MFFLMGKGLSNCGIEVAMNVNVVILMDVKLYFGWQM